MQAEAEPLGVGPDSRCLRRSGAWGRLVLATLACTLALPAAAQPSRSERALRADGHVYFIGELLPEYAMPHAGLPSLEELQDLQFELGRTVDGYVAPREGIHTARFRLSHLTYAPTQRIYASGLRHINEQIVHWLNRHGWRGVRVRPHPDDIEPGSNRDLRGRDQTALRLLITLGSQGPQAQWKIIAASADGPA